MPLKRSDAGDEIGNLLDLDRHATFVIGVETHTAHAECVKASQLNSKYMVPRRGRPSQTWKTFLHNHADGIASIDLFVVPTIAFEQLFAFLVLGHGRRQLLWFAVSRHPTAEWLARQITEAFPWDTATKSWAAENSNGQRLRCASPSDA
jgi:hypothetical protein